MNDEIETAEIKKFKEELRGKSKEELEAIVADGSKQVIRFIIDKLAGLSECQKRVHEMEYHGLDGDPKALREVMSKGWISIERTLNGVLRL